MRIQQLICLSDIPCRNIKCLCLFFRQRLEELEKLQKQIVETDFSTEKKTSNEGEEGCVPEWQEAPTRTGQVDPAIRGQELIRQKLLELTNQMKEKWKIKQNPLRKLI